MIDLNKKYITRAGGKVLHLFHYPHNNSFARIIAIFEQDDQVISACFYEDGAFFGSNIKTSEYDLILVEEDAAKDKEIVAIKEAAEELQYLRSIEEVHLMSKNCIF